MADIDLSSPEVKEAIKAAVEEATTGLIKKRDELLGEVKKLRKNSEIDPEDYQRLKDENDELHGKVTEAQKAAKKAIDEAAKATKQAEAESGAVSKLLVDNGLTESLTKAGVKPEYMKAAKSMLASQVNVVAEGDQRIAKVGDKALSDFVTTWAASDEGKHFVAAQNNSGGGSQGGGKVNANVKTMSRSEFDAKSKTGDPSLQTFFKEGGKIVE